MEPAAQATDLIDRSGLGPQQGGPLLKACRNRGPLLISQQNREFSWRAPFLSPHFLSPAAMMVSSTSS